MKLKPKPIVCNLCGEEMVVEEYAASTLVAYCKNPNCIRGEWNSPEKNRRTQGGE